MKVVALIPHYNHPDTVPTVVTAMQALGIDCLIVDDGSDNSTQQRLQALITDQVTVLYREKNGGKGAAFKTGLSWAQARSYTHILQVDADAQHCLEDAHKLLTLARQHPQAIICALPIYDENAPKSRLYGRKITNFWAAVNTLSLDIKDAMCGFRVYPLAETFAVCETYSIGDRMDFDIDILVRLHRRGIDFKWLSTPVSYAADGVSHFKLWRDNVLISKMHARLFFSMLGRLPRMLWQKFHR